MRWRHLPTDETTSRELKYRAFISYSHRDAGWGQWLHRGLEHYKVPEGLAGTLTPRGEAVPDRIFPVFRDREELPTAVDLGEIISRALEESRYLIVICSPASARSRWVNQEIVQFKRLSGENRVLAIIVDGEPNASGGKPGVDAGQECFPEALRFRLGPEGEISSVPTEPIAADARPHADGRRNALLKLIAGVLGVDYDKLKQRDEVRRRRRQRLLLALVSVIALIICGLAVFAWQKMLVAEAASAEALRQQKVAEAAQAKSNEQLKEASRVSVGVALDHRDRGQEPGIVLAHLVKALAYAPDNVQAQVQAFSLLYRSAHLLPRLPEVSIPHEDPVADAVFSPDGRLIATIASNPEESRYAAHLWDRASGRRVGEPLHHEGVVLGVMFSPDGRYLVTASRDNTAQVWEVASGGKVGAPLEHDDDVNSAFFSPDGARIVTASADDTARIWETATGRPLSEPLPHERDVRQARFSADGRWVVTAAEDGTAKVWQADTGQPAAELKGHDLAVNAAAFSPDGRLVVTAGADKLAILWVAASGARVGEPLRHEGAVLGAEFSPDGRWVVTASEDGTARLWAADTGAPQGKPLRHPAAVVRASFSGDGTRLATACSDGAARVWNVADGRPWGPPFTHEDGLSAVAWSRDGRWLATASKDRTARVWDTAGGQAQPLVFAQGLLGASFSRDGRRALTALDNNVCQVWDAVTGRRVGEPMPHPRGLRQFTLSPDGSHVRTLGGYREQAGNTVHVWDAATGQQISQEFRTAANLATADWSPDSKWIAIVTYNHLAEVWDTATGRQVASRLPHYEDADRHPEVSFSPDSRRLLTAATNESVQVWDPSTGNAVGARLEHEGFLEAAGFSSDSRFVVTAARDNTSRLWHSETGLPATEPLRHPDIVRRALISANGNRVLTIAADNTAQLWDTGTSQPVGELLRYDELIREAAFCPNGRLVLISCGNAVQLLDAATGARVGQPLRHRDRIERASFSASGDWVLTSSHEEPNRISETTRGNQVGQTLAGGHDGGERIGAGYGVFSEDARVILAAGPGGTVMRWETGLASVPLRPFDGRYAGLVSALAGYEISTEGSPRPLRLAERLEQRTAWKKIRPAATTGRSEDVLPYAWEHLLEWLFSDPTTRPISPANPISVPIQIEERIALASTMARTADAQTLLSTSYELNPAHPLIHLGMAAAEENRARRTFLINYGAARLPDEPRILLAGARLLRQLKAPAQAQNVADRLLKMEPGNQKGQEIKTWAQAQLAP